MITDEIVNFTYSRTKLWRKLKLVTKENLKAFFTELADTTLVMRDKKKEIIAVAVYVLRNSYLVFVSLTVDKDIDGFTLIRKFMKDFNYEKTYWVNKKMELKCLPL